MKRYHMLDLFSVLSWSRAISGMGCKSLWAGHLLFNNRSAVLNQFRTTVKLINSIGIAGKLEFSVQSDQGAETVKCTLKSVWEVSDQKIFKISEK